VSLRLWLRRSPRDPRDRIREACSILITGGNRRKVAKSRLAVFFEQIFSGCWCMIRWLLIIHADGIVNIMSKPVPESYYERQTGENLDQALSGMLDALRKPLKLTATLKRRALKNRADEKSTLVEDRPTTASLKRR
jgi:hypothetical protein